MDSRVIDVAEKLLFALAGGLIAYASGRAQARVAAAQRRRVVASAIGAEILRIGDALTHPSTDFQDFVAPTPDIHPWFEQVIIEAAEIDPSIPTRFIELKEQLNALRPVESQMRDDIQRLQGQLATRADATPATHDLDMLDAAIAVTRERLHDNDSKWLYEGRSIAMEKVYQINSLVRAALPRRVRKKIRWSA